MLPGEELPHTGAARLYLDQDVWQERVRSLICRAPATIIIVGESEGVWWEIKTAQNAIASTKLAFVFPLALDTTFTGFPRRDEMPKPRTPPHLLKSLDRALLDAGLQPTPRPVLQDQILILDGDRR